MKSLIQARIQALIKALIKAVTLSIVLAAPVASFAQSVGRSAAQEQQATPVRAVEQHDAAQTETGGYGAGSHGTSQAGVATDTTLSSYSPPIYNARRTYNAH